MDGGWKDMWKALPVGPSVTVATAESKSTRRKKPIRSTINWSALILPLFYNQPEAYAEIRRSTIALNGSFFHTQRMVLQYLRNAYLGVEP